jgi:uncharacterized membrane protein
MACGSGPVAWLVLAVHLAGSVRPVCSDHDPFARWSDPGEKLMTSQGHASHQPQHGYQVPELVYPDAVVSAGCREYSSSLQGSVRPGQRGTDWTKGEGASSMSTTAWRFTGTEGADAAVLRLKQLDSQGLVDVQDVAIIRWPQYSSAPQVQEHVTEEGSMASSLAKRFKKAGIDGAMLSAVKDDMTLGTSALVLLSVDAAIDQVAKAFEGQAMELIRSDLSVQREDELRAAFSSRSS